MDKSESGKITMRAARMLSGYTLKEVAAQIGISASALGRYERDSGKIPCSVVVKLLRLYKLKTTELIHIGKEADA